MPYFVHTTMSALRIVNIVDGVLELHGHIRIIIEHTTYYIASTQTPCCL